MNSIPKKVRALGLCSGGLDSMLAGLVLRKQGIDVEWITFETPFFSADKARRASRLTGIPLTVQNITQPYMVMMKNPPCGYGQHMNPCLDCHTLMFKMAGKRMAENGFDFLFSGEVLGQRPMSQTKPSLRYVEKNSGYNGYILRPLSAKNLPETVPERQGLVERQKLLDISGRSRKPQIKLAAEFGIDEYPAPAGGCLLTDKGYSSRLKDLFQHQNEYTENELHLLKYGRHFRLKDQTKLIIGRTQADNDQIIAYHNPQKDTVIKVKNYPGPAAIVPNGASKEIITLAASICTGYSKAPALTQVEVNIKTPALRETIKVLGLLPSDIKHFLI
jgi:tRNA U34 2-thiouridine synthase MnmA/TrmU